MRASSVTHRNFRTLLIAAIISSCSLLSLPTAHSVTGYRYWGYFQAAAGTHVWKAAMTGPTTTLKDGDVEGWAFSFSNNDIPATPPSAVPDFGALCGSTPVVAGKIRVGLVINFGSSNIAPEGESPSNSINSCVNVKTGATGNDVLSAAVEVRNDKSGILCAINKYPKSECGPQVDISAEQLNGTTTLQQGKAGQESAGQAGAGHEGEERRHQIDEQFEHIEPIQVALVLLAILIAVTIAVSVSRRRKSSPH